MAGGLIVAAFAARAPNRAVEVEIGGGKKTWRLTRERASAVAPAPTAIAASRAIPNEPGARSLSGRIRSAIGAQERRRRSSAPHLRIAANLEHRPLVMCFLAIRHLNPWRLATFTSLAPPAPFDAKAKAVASAPNAPMKGRMGWWTRAIAHFG
jgi:hypothetical protein